MTTSLERGVTRGRNYLPDYRAATRALVAALGGPASVGQQLSPPLTRRAVCGWPRVPADHVRGVVTLARRLGYLHEGRPLEPVDVRPDVFAPITEPQAPSPIGSNT